MDHLGVDVKGRRLFAAAFDNHTLEVIDLQAGRQVHTIRDLDKPRPFFSTLLAIASSCQAKAMAR